MNYIKLAYAFYSITLSLTVLTFADNAVNFNSSTNNGEVTINQIINNFLTNPTNDSLRKEVNIIKQLIDNKMLVELNKNDDNLLIAITNLKKNISQDNYIEFKLNFPEYLYLFNNNKSFIKRLLVIAFNIQNINDRYRLNILRAITYHCDSINISELFIQSGSKYSFDECVLQDSANFKGSNLDYLSFKNVDFKHAKFDSSSSVKNMICYGADLSQTTGLQKAKGNLSLQYDTKTVLPYNNVLNQSIIKLQELEMQYLNQMHYIAGMGLIFNTDFTALGISYGFKRNDNFMMMGGIGFSFSKVIDIDITDEGMEKKNIYIKKDDYWIMQNSIVHKLTCKSLYLPILLDINLSAETPFIFKSFLRFEAGISWISYKSYDLIHVETNDELRYFDTTVTQVQCSRTQQLFFPALSFSFNRQTLTFEYAKIFIGCGVYWKYKYPVAFIFPITVGIGKLPEGTAFLNSGFSSQGYNLQFGFNIHVNKNMFSNRIHNNNEKSKLCIACN